MLVCVSFVMHGIECCIIHLFLFFKLFSFKHCVFAFICTSVNYIPFCLYHVLLSITDYVLRTTTYYVLRTTTYYVLRTTTLYLLRTTTYYVLLRTTYYVLLGTTYYVLPRTTYYYVLRTTDYYVLRTTYYYKLRTTFYVLRTTTYCVLRTTTQYVLNPPTTIPPTVLTTSLRPDLVILENQDSIRMLELTVPTNTPEGLRIARDRKQNKTEYGIPCVDLEDKGWTVSYDTIEIGSLGHYTSSTSETVILTLPLEHIQSTKRILQEAAKTAISCSQQIFLAHKRPDWNPTRPLI